MNVLPADLDTKRRQRRASDPKVSAWVSANAGAGKTTVLRNRVLRLLLEGVDPGRILCLTFTKAAAAEMSNRVFAELSRWVGLDDLALAGAIADIAGCEPSIDTLAQARRLFARAIETPGGLRIDTIHGFCTRLLQAFAFEANVPARFVVLEEAEAHELLARAQQDVLQDALSRRDDELFRALSRVGEDASGAGFTEVMQGVLDLKFWKSKAAREASFFASLPRRLSEALGIDASLTSEAIEADILDHAKGALGRRIAAALGKGGKEKQELARRFCAATDSADCIASYQAMLLTGDGTPRAKMLTKAAAASDSSLAEAMRDEASWLIQKLDSRRAVETRERSFALLLIARATRRRFASLKAARGALDFDDLIGATGRLLSRASAAFVLYKLDAAIEHLLVDEAQDTNAEYWDILRALTAEFTAGHGARGGRTRTVFAVGDEKQSIFGFQGAEPRIFGEMREAFARDYAPLARDGETSFDKVVLNVSFRSTKDVLSAVDAVFAPPHHYEGLTADGTPPPAHVSTRLSEPGAVDLWSLETGDGVASTDPFQPPMIGSPLLSAQVKLARRIAETIRCWTREGCDLGRRVNPGDVLILVRRRGPAFEAVIRALKRAGVPVAGADRLSLSSHIAVDDLVAAGRAALLPDDDLTVASLLKSPVFGLSDKDLLSIAAKRRSSLRQALREAASTDPRLACANARLDELRRMGLALGPFGFFAKLLGPQGGREALAARLGDEAAEVSDEVLRLALKCERGPDPSLLSFLDLLQSSGGDIKRDLSAARGEVRVMTVHGSKGLEAPIVILADACSSPDKTERFLMLPSASDADLPVWVPRKTLDSAATMRARAAAEAEQAREDRRLLYVAMTRARDRLIIAGCEPTKGQVPTSSWYRMAELALASTPPGLSPLPAEGDPHPKRRWRVTNDQAAAAATKREQPTIVEEPGWLRRSSPLEPLSKPPLRPSSALDAAEGAEPAQGEADADALLAGRFAHALLEHLPSVAPARRPKVAGNLTQLLGEGLPEPRRGDIIGKVLDLLGNPTLAPLFSAASRAEVEISGEVVLTDGQSHSVSGRVDRLALTSDAVLIADYKTGISAAGRARDQAVAQLAIYRRLASGIFPGRAIRALLVLLDQAQIVEPSNRELDEALEAVLA
jgi:ATP-dependent helicase/nuclease subunit A